MKTTSLQAFLKGIFQETPVAWKWVRNTVVGSLIWLHTEGEALKDFLVNIKIPHLFGLTAYHVTVVAGSTLVAISQSKTNTLPGTEPAITTPPVQ